MLKHKHLFILFLLYSLLNGVNCYAGRPGFAPVSGFARSFIMGSEIGNANITIVETGKIIKTDNHGKFGPFDYPVGKPITLMLVKSGYHTTQSATVVVPPEGLTGPYNNITFQVPSSEAYYLLSTVVGAKEDPNACHVAATITAYHKNMDDDPQGEADATVSLRGYTEQPTFYFDIFQSGPLKGKTNPFTKGLTKTTEDGGLLIFNLPPQEKPYVMTASKAGVMFTEIQFLCRKGMFVNISPPQGPMAVQ